MNFTNNPWPGAAAAPQPAAYASPSSPDPVESPWDTEASVPADQPPAQPAAEPPPAEPAEDVTVEATPEEHLFPADPMLRRAAAEAAREAATWLGLYRQPPSVRDAWDMSSSINRNRVPEESGLLAFGWWVWNRTARIALFAVIVVLLAVVSTLLWCACRPTRGIGLGVVLLIVFVVVPALTGG